MTVTLVLVARYDSDVVFFARLFYMAVWERLFVLLQIAFRHDLLLDILEYDEEDWNDD